MNHLTPVRRSIFAFIPPSLCTAIMYILYGVTGPAVCAQTPSPVVNSPDAPVDVSIPAGFSNNPIAFFDDYSWRAFIAMVWPAQAGQRGKPDRSATVGGIGPRVFETYKALWEVFHRDGTAPGAWDNQEMAQYNPCGVALKWGEYALGSFSKFSDFGQAGIGSLVGPLVAQPASGPTYVRFSTAFNQVEFNFIVNPTPGIPKPLYLRSNLEASAPIVFPEGSIDIKASWVDVANVSNPTRFYTRQAWVMDPATGKASLTTVGLVGLHIVQKTPSRPQWIWSTFEHVDNVPEIGGTAGARTFNSGDGVPMPKKNPYSISPLPLPIPAPFNVDRTKPIHTSTQQTNNAYRQSLHGTVWENYQLVMTQWPITPNRPDQPGDVGHTFPGSAGDTTAFANTTLETFDQGHVQTSCMNCHNFARDSADFVWSLQDHAFPPDDPQLLMRRPSFRGLRTLMHQAAEDDSKK